MSLLGGLLCVLVLSIFNYFFQSQFVAFFNGMGWSSIAGFVSGLWWKSVPTWLVPIVALLGVIISIERSKRSSNASIAVGLFHEISSNDFKEKLELIYKLNREKTEYLTREEKQASEHVIDWLGFLGSLVQKGVTDVDLTVNGFAGHCALRCWYQLGSYVRQLQHDRGSYGENYEDFVRLCCKRFKHDNLSISFRDARGQLIIDDLAKTLLSNNYPLRPRTLKEIRYNIGNDKTSSNTITSPRTIDLISFGLAYLSFSVAVLTLKNDPTYHNISTVQRNTAYAFICLSALCAVWAMWPSKIKNISLRFPSKLRLLMPELLWRREIKVYCYLLLYITNFMAWYLMFAMDWILGIVRTGGPDQQIISWVGIVWLLCIATATTRAFFKYVNSRLFEERFPEIKGIKKWLPLIIPLLILLQLLLNGLHKDLTTWILMFVFVGLPTLVALGWWTPVGRLPFMDD